jgi:hypothetical protein
MGRVDGDEAVAEQMVSDFRKHALQPVSADGEHGPPVVLLGDREGKVAVHMAVKPQEGCPI